MSQKALEVDPNNWKALLNKADLQSKLAVPEDERDLSEALRTLKNTEKDTDMLEEELVVHRKSVDDLLKCLTLPNADKQSINQILLPIYRIVANNTGDMDEALKSITGAIEISEDTTTLFMRCKIYMHLGEWRRAVMDGEKILELDKNFMGGE